MDQEKTQIINFKYKTGENINVFNTLYHFCFNYTHLIIT